jgi:glycosyltransferase involved in cell wall biosynthesis
VKDIYFSIIIPTFNREQLLVTTIHSVLNQTFSNFEIIVVDDGSTDNTKFIIEQMILSEPRIRYYYQSNSERAVARNKGVELSYGDYLIFLDSDDTFSYEDHLQKLYDFTNSKKNNLFLCFTGAIIDNGLVKVKTKDYTDIEITNFDFFTNESIVPARVCLSKGIFELCQFDPDCIVVEDTVLWTSIMEKFPIYYLPIFSVTYKLHADNSVNINKTNAYLLRLKGLEKLFKHYQVGKKITQKTKSVQLNRCHIGIVEFYQLSANKKQALFWLLLSLLRYPTIEFKHKVKLLFKLF